MKKLLLAGALLAMTGLAATPVFANRTNSNRNSAIIGQTENNEQSDNVRENGYRNEIISQSLKNQNLVKSRF